MPTTENVAPQAGAPDLDVLRNFRDLVFPPDREASRGIPVLTGPKPDTLPNPETGRVPWVTMRWPDDAAPDMRSLYFVPTTFGVTNARQTPGRTEADAVQCFAVVMDDVGYKIPPALFDDRAAPSFRLETSAGNFQYVYLLTRPELPATVKAIYGGCAAAGLTDAGTARIIQPFRVPGSINEKPGRDGWVTRLHWPEGIGEGDNVTTYTAEELVSGLRIVPREAARISLEVTPLAAGQNDPVFEWLHGRGLLLGSTTRGFNDMVCPWNSEHGEGGAEFAGYKPGRPGAFYCWHGHCAGRGASALVSWIEGQDPDAARAMRAAIAELRGAALADLGAALAAVSPPAAVAQAVAESGARQQVDALGTEASATLAASGRVRILVDAGLRHLAIRDTVDVLPSLAPAVFRRAGGLVYVSPVREITVYDDAGQASRVPTLGMERVSVEWLQTRLGERVDYRKTQGRGLVPRDPPRDVVAGVLKEPLPNVPPLDGIVATPTMRRDGSLMLEPGYDPATGFWLAHDLTVAVPERPTKADAESALALLRGLLAEYPFERGAGSVDEAVALALLMTVVLRPAFANAPGFLINATAAGSGKSHLTELAGLLGNGAVPPMTTWRPGEEVVKHLDALLIAGVPFIAFDNANEIEIGGHKFCATLTAGAVDVRPLGTSQSVTVSTASVVVVVNGNRPIIMEDAASRMLTTSLAPTQLNPRERTFAGDPLPLVQRDRGKYVAAVLTVARAYVLAGRPGAVGYGSFQDWSRLVRSSLIWLGLPDVLASVQQAVADDPARLKLATVAGLIASRIGLGRAFTAGALVAACNMADGTDAMVLAGAVAGDRDAGLAGERLSRAVGQFFRLKMNGRWLALADGREAVLKRTGATRDSTAEWTLLGRAGAGGAA